MFDQPTILSPVDQGRYLQPLVRPALFGTCDYRAPGWEQLQASAKTGDRFGGYRKNGAWDEVTARVLEGFMEGRHFCRFVYVGWKNEEGRKCEETFENFATMHREIMPLPNKHVSNSSQDENG